MQGRRARGECGAVRCRERRALGRHRGTPAFQGEQKDGEAAEEKTGGIRIKRPAEGHHESWWRVS